MKKLTLRYFLPALFGVVIYISIRLVTDAPGPETFWHRSFHQNFVEIAGCIVLGYISQGSLLRIINRYEKKTPRFQIRNLVQEFLALTVLCALLVNPTLYVIHYLANDPLESADVVIANVIVGLYLLLYYAVIRGNRIIRSYVIQQVQMERLKNDQLETELKFLKAQYHPHFLFNALNTIYFQMDEDVGQAKRTVEKFARLLRYQIYDQHQPVMLKQELEHLQDFIDLQKQRSTDKLKLDLFIDAALGREKLYPLLLLPLVENAFKHIGGSFEIKITAKKEADVFVFMVQNGIRQVTQKKGGIGLENLQRRLELLYPKQHELYVTEGESQSTAMLKLAGL